MWLSHFLISPELMVKQKLNLDRCVHSSSLWITFRHTLELSWSMWIYCVRVQRSRWFGPETHSSGLWDTGVLHPKGKCWLCLLFNGPRLEHLPPAENSTGHSEGVRKRKQFHMLPSDEGGRFVCIDLPKITQASSRTRAKSRISLPQCNAGRFSRILTMVEI